MVNDNVAENHTLRASILEQLGRAEEVKNELIDHCIAQTVIVPENNLKAVR